MIIVRRIVIGTEHGAETAAARFMERAEEVLRRLVAVPAAVEHDAAWKIITDFYANIEER